MTYAIEVENLYKAFKHEKTTIKAVDGLSFAVPTGTVYGFLGHNGAGKSTTIRVMLGLTSATSGEVRIFGQPAAQANALLQERVGSLVDGATHYPYLSGRANLEVLARTSGHYDRTWIDTLLKRVGLTEAADRPTRGYSTGMKQRLGIAAALLNNPDLVILDEPTNGLDPAGIQEIRQLIRRLVDDDGKTVMLSSHLLHEVEQVCDRVAIIQKGRLMSEGAVEDLLADQTQIRLRAHPTEQAATLLAADYDVTLEDAWLVVRGATQEHTPNILRRLVLANVDVFQVVPHRLTLEEYFMTVVNGQQPEQEAMYA